MNKASLRIIRTLTFFSGRRGHLRLLFSLMNRIRSNKKFWPWILKSRLLLCKHFFTNFHPSENLEPRYDTLYTYLLYTLYILLFVAKFETCWISCLTYRTSRKSYIFCREDRNRLKRSIKKSDCIQVDSFVTNFGLSELIQHKVQNNFQFNFTKITDIKLIQRTRYCRHLLTRTENGKEAFKFKEFVTKVDLK